MEEDITLEELIESLSYERYDAIVVEGYDGVGKGRILKALSDYYGVTPYRPDYNFWQQYDHRNKDRWKISGFFLDVYSHFHDIMRTIEAPMLFDRGVISGAVYNQDTTIAENYKSILRDLDVMHILVECSKEDYIRYLHSRDVSSIDEEMEWEKCVTYTRNYKYLLEIAGVNFIVYRNAFNEELYNNSIHTCAGCGHYSYGICRHPKKNCIVSESEERCEYSTEKEVQDRDVREMQQV